MLYTKHNGEDKPILFNQILIILMGLLFEKDRNGHMKFCIINRVLFFIPTP